MKFHYYDIQFRFCCLRAWSLNYLFEAIMAGSGDSVESVYKSFCAFGAGSNNVAMMDNAKLAKLTRDCKLLDKKLTATDVDIIFSKVKKCVCAIIKITEVLLCDIIFL